MIYPFTITETNKTTIPVRANSADEAQKIFWSWYEKHENDPEDDLIDTLLENGFDGRKFERFPGKIDEEEYFAMHKLNPFASGIVLPEEKNEPEEPKFDMHIRFADGSEAWTCIDRTLGEIGLKMAELSSKYYLYPDDTVNSGRNHDFWLYAVLKDEKETWYQFNNDAEG